MHEMSYGRGTHFLECLGEPINLEQQITEFLSVRNPTILPYLEQSINLCRRHIGVKNVICFRKTYSLVPFKPYPKLAQRTKPNINAFSECLCLEIKVTLWGESKTNDVIQYVSKRLMCGLYITMQGM